MLCVHSNLGVCRFVFEVGVGDCEMICMYA